MKLIRSRSNRCEGCLLAGQFTGGPPGTPHCKTFRLCEGFDTSMVVNYPGKTVAEYLAMQREIAVRLETVKEELIGWIPLVQSGSELVELVRFTHQRIFTPAFGADAGRFRSTDERVWVGLGDNEYEGVRGDKIEQELAALGDRIHGLTRNNIESFAKLAARFICDLFAIHPFRDGNGRTGRAIVEAAANASGLVFVRPYTEKRQNAEDAREYLRALEYAHEHLGRTNASARFRFDSPTDPYRPFAKWWRLRLQTLEQLDEEIDKLYRDLTNEEAWSTDLMFDFGTDDPLTDAYESVFNQWLMSPSVQSLRLPRIPTVPGRCDEV